MTPAGGLQVILAPQGGLKGGGGGAPTIKVNVR